MNADEDRWHQPGPPAYGSPGQPDSGSPGSHAYGQPGSPAYGQYGEGVAEPTRTPPPAGRGTYDLPFRPAGRLGVAVAGLAILVTVTLWGSALVAVWAGHVIETRTGTAAADDAYLSYLASVVLRIPFLAAGWIVTSVWLGIARGNAVQLDPHGQRYAAPWVWLGWLVPIVQYWFPKLILDDAIRATAAAARRPAPGTGWFWAAWIALGLLQGFQFQIIDETQVTVDSVRPALDLAVAVVGTVALVLWVLLVRRVSAIQNELAEPTL